MNMRELQANIRGLERRLIDKIKREVEDASLDLWRKSAERAPKDTGDLRGSAHAKPVVEHSGKIIGEVGFQEEYALRQHEEMGYNHPQGGEAKYLENPMKENEDRYIRAIKNAVREELI